MNFYQSKLIILISKVFDKKLNNYNIDSHYIGVRIDVYKNIQSVKTINYFLERLI